MTIKNIPRWYQRRQEQERARNKFMAACSGLIKKAIEAEECRVGYAHQNQKGREEA